MATEIVIDPSDNGCGYLAVAFPPAGLMQKLEWVTRAIRCAAEK